MIRAFFIAVFIITVSCVGDPENHHTADVFNEADGKNSSLNKVGVYLKDSSWIPVNHPELSLAEFEYIQPVENAFVVIHRKPSGISVINQRGELMTQLGSRGRGPFELGRPSLIQSHKNKLIIWDSVNLKFLVFDDRFNSIREFMGARHAINGFSLNNQEVLAVLNQPRWESEFVHIYRKSSAGEFHPDKSLGNLTDEGRTMFFHSMSGGILWNGDDLVWADPAISAFFVYNVQEDQEKKIVVPDRLFSIEKWIETGRMTRQTLDKIRDYFASNSRVVSLHKLYDHILVEMEHFPAEKPVIIYHLFNFEYNYVAGIEAGDGGWVNYIRGVDGNRLLYWGEDYTQTGEMNSIRVRELVFE